jgi:XTP/dITP diphosphohydrolase
LLYRAEKYGVDINVPNHSTEAAATQESVGSALLAVIAWAHKNGIDPEDALRMQSKQIMREITQQESR